MLSKSDRFCRKVIDCNIFNGKYNKLLIAIEYSKISPEFLKLIDLIIQMDDFDFLTSTLYYMLEKSYDKI